MPAARRQNIVGEEVPDDVRAQGASARRAWLRERIARRQARDYEERANEAQVAEASRPLCEYFDPTIDGEQCYLPLCRAPGCWPIVP